jgi:hypothetical protein
MLSFSDKKILIAIFHRSVNVFLSISFAISKKSVLCFCLNLVSFAFKSNREPWYQSIDIYIYIGIKAFTIAKTSTGLHEISLYKCM